MLDDEGWRGAERVETWFETNPGDNTPPKVGTFEERAEVLSWLSVEPFWDTIRDDARFRDLSERVGF